MRYECGITIIRKIVTKARVIEEPLECVSRLRRVTGTVVEIAVRWVGNIVRLEDKIGRLTSRCEEFGQKTGVDKPSVWRLPENRNNGGEERSR